MVWPEVRIYTDCWAGTNTMNYLGFGKNKNKRLVKSKLMEWVCVWNESLKIVPEPGNVCTSSKYSAEGPRWTRESLIIR